MSVAYHALAGPLECSWKSGNCGAFYALETIRQYDHPMDALISGSGFSYRAFYSQSCSVAYYLAQCCFDAVLFFFSQPALFTAVSSCAVLSVCTAGAGADCNGAWPEFFWKSKSVAYESFFAPTARRAQQIFPCLAVSRPWGIYQAALIYNMFPYYNARHTSFTLSGRPITHVFIQRWNIYFVAFKKIRVVLSAN